MKTITGNTEAEIVEKRSKFISNLYYVETVEQAENKLKEIKKRYNDARHNCFAYRVCEKNTIVERASDDGEPSGTAGAPMLNLLSKSDLTNCVVIVTRYFGGILLGTGGLVRCYTKATTESIKNAIIVEKEIGYKIKFVTNYNKQEELKYYLKQNLCNIIDTTYLEKIEIIAEISEKVKKEIEENLVKKDKMYECAEILETKYIDKRTK